MDLPTYTSIWRIEKRLYKLYDFRLPMPLPIGQVTVFAAITVPYVVLLTVLGLPFNHTLIWLYILPPGLATWLVTRPVLESKRLPELIKSQLRYLAEPRILCRMAPLSERDIVVVTGRIWRPRAGRRQAEFLDADAGDEMAAEELAEMPAGSAGRVRGRLRKGPLPPGRSSDSAPLPAADPASPGGLPSWIAAAGPAGRARPAGSQPTRNERARSGARIPPSSGWPRPVGPRSLECRFRTPRARPVRRPRLAGRWPGTIRCRPSQRRRALSRRMPFVRRQASGSRRPRGTLSRRRPQACRRGPISLRGPIWSGPVWMGHPSPLSAMGGPSIPARRGFRRRRQRRQASMRGRISRNRRQPSSRPLRDQRWPRRRKGARLTPCRVNGPYRVSQPDQVSQPVSQPDRVSRPDLVSRPGLVSQPDRRGRLSRSWALAPRRRPAPSVERALAGPSAPPRRCQGRGGWPSSPAGTAQASQICCSATEPGPSMPIGIRPRIVDPRLHGRRRPDDDRRC